MENTDNIQSWSCWWRWKSMIWQHQVFFLDVYFLQTRGQFAILRYWCLKQTQEKKVHRKRRELPIVIFLAHFCWLWIWQGLEQLGRRITLYPRDYLLTVNMGMFYVPAAPFDIEIRKWSCISYSSWQIAHSGEILTMGNVATFQILDQLEK